MNVNFIIEEVIDNDTGKRSKSFGYRIGRECYMNLDYLQLNVPLIVNYTNGSHFVSTGVKVIKQDIDGFWITTRNRKYRFRTIR